MSDEVYVHYYPGNNSAAIPQLTRYAGNREIQIPETGEIASNKHGIDLFDPKKVTLVAPPMTEIKTKPDEATGFFSKMFAFILHWLSSIPSMVSHWFRGIQITDNPDNQSSSADSSDKFRYFRVDNSERSLGQFTDIKNVKQYHADFISTLSTNTKMIYFGVSRGAATTFSALAQIKPTTHQAICILEAPPSSLSGVFKKLGSDYFGSRGFGKWIYQNFAPLFLGKQHQTKRELQARGHVDEFPLTMPLMIVSSKKDKTVPHENTIRLAARVAESRRKAKQDKQEVAPIYFLQLDNVDHNEYATSKTEDSIRYRNAVHAMYQKHGFPCNQSYANDGKQDLELSDLSSEQYNSYLEIQEQFWRDKNPEERNEARKSACTKLKKEQEIQTIPDRVASVVSELPLFKKTLPNSDSSHASTKTNTKQTKV